MAEVLDKYKINGVSYTCVGFKKDRRVAILFDGKRNRDFDVEKGHFVGETKVCEDCKKDLPLDKFSIVRGGKLRNQCRECFGIRVSKGHARARIDDKKKTKETVETPVNAEPEKEKVTLTNKEIYEAEMTRHQEKVKAIVKREEKETKETKETTKVDEDMVNRPNHYKVLMAWKQSTLCGTSYRNIRMDIPQR